MPKTFRERFLYACWFVGGGLVVALITWLLGWKDATVVLLAMTPVVFLLALAGVLGGE